MSASTAPLLSVVIVNFNGRHFLHDCLRSVQERAGVPCEIILVDNASADGSGEYVRQRHPEVSLIESPVNLGFTGGNNLGARAAKGQYLLLLNNDTVVLSSFAPLVDRMRHDDNIGVLGCRLAYGDGRLQESAGYMPTVLSLILSWTPLARLFPRVRMFRRTIWRGSPLYGQESAEVEWVSGACLLTRTDLWQRLEGLDQRYFMYMEEVDYCHRVRDAGYRVEYSSMCAVTHYEGAGRSWVGERAVLNTAQSYMTYFAKFRGSVATLALRAGLAPVFLLRSVAHWATGIVHRDPDGFAKSGAYLRAAWLLLRGIRPRSPSVVR